MLVPNTWIPNENLENRMGSGLKKAEPAHLWYTHNNKNFELGQNLQITFNFLKKQ